MEELITFVLISFYYFPLKYVLFILFLSQVDHFGFNTVKTFNQRYLVADKYWKKNGGSILFYTGNEGDIIWFCNNTVCADS